MKPVNVKITASGLSKSGSYEAKDAGMWYDTVFDSDMKEIIAIVILRDGKVVGVPTRHINADLTE